MSRAVQGVVGVVEIAAGAIMDDYAPGSGNWLIASGASMLLGFAASLIANPHRTPLQPIGASYTGALEPPTRIPTAEELVAMYLVEE